MKNNRQAVQIVAKLYEAQESLKNLLGEKYEGTIAPFKEAIQKGFEEEKGDFISFGLHLLQEMKAEGSTHTTIWKTIAALVEIAEEREEQV